MYLKKLRLQNIKCFEDVTLEFPHKGGDYSGWVVLVGENGTGKSTLVRAVAEVIIELADSSWIYDDEWVSQCAQAGSIEGTLCGTRFDDPRLRGGGAERFPSAGINKQLTLRSIIEHPPLKRHARTNLPVIENTPGWLACGYGPFRRLGASMAPVRPGHDPFLTLLLDDVGITEPFEWLKRMYGKSLDPKVKDNKRLREDFPLIVEVINRLLPKSVQVEDVSTEAVRFVTIGDARVGAHGLSDGFRSFLALAVDLLMRVYQATDRFSKYLSSELESGLTQITAEGIVLIDEADAHLHPSWQRELKDRLCRVFPKIQFIVTTHSPFIAQEATDDGLFVLTRAENGSVTVEQPIDSVRGWTASQILTSPLFGLDSTRDPETESLVQETTALTSKEKAGKLTAVAKQRLSVVRDLLTKTLSAPGETYDEMRQHQDMDDYVQETLKRLKNGKP